jgi:hypothetical protein
MHQQGAFQKLPWFTEARDAEDRENKYEKQDERDELVASAVTYKRRLVNGRICVT